MRALTAAESLLNNASFDGEHVGATVTKVPSWTILTDATDFSRDTAAANIYRHKPGASSSTSASLKIAAGASDTISQAIDVRNTALSEFLPYQLQVAYRVSSTSITGTLTIHMGSQTKALDLSTVPDTGWKVLTLDFDQNLWLPNFNEDALDIKIQVASLAVGDLYIDDVIFAPMVRLDAAGPEELVTENHGGYFWPVGGATHWLLGDAYTMADAVSTEAILAYWFWWAGYGSFPSATGGAETWADP